MLKFLLLSSVLLTSVAGLIAQEQGVNWLTDHKAARALARETGKPLLFDFSAKWCGPCKAMEKSFWPRADVIEASKSFICVKVDFDKEQGFANKYGIHSIPNVLFTDPWGRGLKSQVGYGASVPDKIFDKIKTLPTDYSSILAAGNTLAENDKDLAALSTMADFYQQRKYFWISQDFYEDIVKIESDPAKREAAMANLAFNYVKLGELNDALDKFETLQKEYPDSKQTDAYLFGVAVAQARKKKFDKAEKTLADLKTRFPGSGYLAETERSIAAARKAKD